MSLGTRNPGDRYVSISALLQYYYTVVLQHWVCCSNVGVELCVDVNAVQDRLLISS